MANGFSHPTMISTNSGAFKEIDNKRLVKQNLKLLLETSKTELLGDPFFGTNLTRLLFEPNDVILRDLIIDEIYLAIRTFLKEISVRRSDIKIKQFKSNVEISINFQYNIDGTNDIYNIKLTSGEM